MRALRFISLALIASLALPARSADSVAAPPVERCPAEATATRTFSMALAGNRAGYHVECHMPDGSGLYLFAFNDRGRGPAIRSRIAVDAAGIPNALTVDGNDYLKNPIAERFAAANGEASWKNKVEEGARKLAGPAFYLSQSGTPAELPMLAKAAMAAPGRQISLLPSGEARVEALDTRTVKSGDASKDVRLYAVYGLGYQPTTVWLEANGDFFASLDSWVAIVPEGWESTAPELLKVQEARLTALRIDQAAKLRQTPAGSLLIEHANVFDAEARAMKPGTSVLIEDVAFAVEHLAPAVRELQRLFALHGYDEGIVFGHAKDGNIHFVITQSFDTGAEVFDAAGELRPR